VKIVVVDNRIEATLKQLKKQMLKDGLFSGDEEARVLREAVGEAEA